MEPAKLLAAQETPEFHQEGNFPCHSPAVKDTPWIACQRRHLSCTIPSIGQYTTTILATRFTPPLVEFDTGSANNICARCSIMTIHALVWNSRFCVTSSRYIGVVSCRFSIACRILPSTLTPQSNGVSLSFLWCPWVLLATVPDTLISKKKAGNSCVRCHFTI